MSLGLMLNFVAQYGALVAWCALKITLDMYASRQGIRLNRLMTQG